MYETFSFFCLGNKQPETLIPRTKADAETITLVQWLEKCESPLERVIDGCKLTTEVGFTRYLESDQTPYDYLKKYPAY